MCIFSLQCSAGVEGQLKKQCGEVGPLKWTWKVLITLTMLYQKNSLSHEKYYGHDGSGSSLSGMTPPENMKNHRCFKIKMQS